MAELAEPEQAPIAKLDVNFSLDARKHTTVIVGKKGQQIIIDDTLLNHVHGSLYIGNCEECDFTLTGTCNKILIDSCKNTRITLNGHVITNVFEICNCEDLVSIINCRISTLQADLCRKLRVEFSLRELFKQLVWAAAYDLTLSFRDATEHRLETGFAQMKEKHLELCDTDQFCVRFVNNVLLQELIVRLAGGYPSTERESRFFDQEARRRDEHMLQAMARMVKFMPKKQLLPPASGNTGSANCAPPGPKKYTLSILALGDSLTEGLTAWGEPFQPYSKFLPDMLAPSIANGWSAEVTNQGICGETSTQIKRRAPYTSAWDFVVLLAGTNDLGTQEVDGIWANLQEMYTAFEEANAVVVAVTVPSALLVHPQWLMERRNVLNERIRAWVSDKPSRLLIDLWAEMKVDDAHRSLWAADGLHFSVEGYRHFSSLIAKNLRPLLASSVAHRCSKD